MMMGGIFYLLLFAFSFSMMTQQPWLGVKLKEIETGSAVVTDITVNGPSHQVITEGTVIYGIHCQQQTVLFNDYSFVEDPEETPTYRTYREFFEHQQALYQCQGDQQLRYILSDGLSQPVTPQASRPLLNIPIGYWITHALGISTLIFSLGIWSHRRREVSSRLLVLWSISIAFIVHTMSVYGFRELTIEPDLFQWIHHTNRFSVIILSVTIFTLICYYPVRLSKFPFASVLLPLGVLLGLNELFQVLQWPWQTFYFVSMLVYLLSFITLALQWQHSRKSAINRAAVIWFIWSIVLTNGGALAFYALPTVFGEEPLTSLWIGQGFFLLMFFGFALGVVRYRLFEVEQWWLMTWIWFLGGLLVILLDSLLIIFLNLNPAGALSIAVLVVAWAYLPVRQWLWNRLFKRNDYRLETYLPQFIDAQFSTPDAQGFNNQWPRFLAQVFHCADVAIQPGQLEKIYIADNGCDLKVPTINADNHVVLAGKERGNRLFNQKDISLASGLYNLAIQTMSLREEQDKAVTDERNRIMRDLHDDLGAQLLALVHLSETRQTANIARQALKSLREMVYAFRDTGGVKLAELLTKWREELMQRTESANRQGYWKQSDIPSLMLTARQGINLGSIFREAVTNALKHAHSGMLEVSVSCQQQTLMLIISNDGIEQSCPSDWVVGAGRANMTTRAAEIKATIEWKLNSERPGKVDVVVTMPIPDKIYD